MTKVMEWQSDGHWFRPVLEREGQTAFWDRQSDTYSQKPMTVDNDRELDQAAQLCMGIPDRGGVVEDIVTFGGANATRDPTVLIEALHTRGQAPKKVYFNDLSTGMTAAAQAHLAARYDGVVSLHPGAVHEIADQIPAKPRRVIIGLYGLLAFLRSSVAAGSALSGIETYVRNGTTLGNRFFFEPVSMTAGKFGDVGMMVTLGAYPSDLHLKAARDSLEAYCQKLPVAAIRAIGVHQNEPGFFLSHWYAEERARELIAHCFPDAGSIKRLPCAKGFVFCVDPVEPPQGIVTILNNVIGNVLPHEQADTLRAISRIAR